MERKSRRSKSRRSKSPRSKSPRYRFSDPYYEEYFSIDEGPTEVLVEIMEQMDYETLKSWCGTNRRIKSICDSNFGRRLMERKYAEFLRSQIPSYDNWFAIKNIEGDFTIRIIFPIKNKSQGKRIMHQIDSQQLSYHAFSQSMTTFVDISLFNSSLDENTFIGSDRDGNPFQLVKHSHRKIVFPQDMTIEEKNATSQDVKVSIKGFAKSFRRIIHQKRRSISLWERYRNLRDPNREDRLGSD